jgi:hypothetical protein
MQTLLLFAGCGAAGALTYSFPLYLKAKLKIPPARFALANCLFSIFVGAISAVVFTRLIGFQFPWTIQPEPWPLAMVVGLGSNPLVPILVRRLESWAGNFEGK